MSLSEIGPDLEPDTELDEYSGDYGEFEEMDFEALGIDPQTPTGAKPGSEDKVMMLAARYAAGLPLWNEQDCYDHGPDRHEPIDEFEDDEDD